MLVGPLSEVYSYVSRRIYGGDQDGICLECVVAGVVVIDHPCGCKQTGCGSCGFGHIAHFGAVGVPSGQAMTRCDVLCFLISGGNNDDPRSSDSASTVA